MVVACLRKGAQACNGILTKLCPSSCCAVCRTDQAWGRDSRPEGSRAVLCLQCCIRRAQTRSVGPHRLVQCSAGRCQKQALAGQGSQGCPCVAVNCCFPSAPRIHAWL